MIKTITINTETHRVVPVEPTIKMMDGAFDNISLSDAHSTYGVTQHVWDFMLAAAPEFNESPWLHIESAPKDGTRILVRRDELVEPVTIGYWSMAECRFVTPLVFISYTPTHWMPLPSALEGI